MPRHFSAADPPRNGVTLTWDILTALHRMEIELLDRTAGSILFLQLTLHSEQMPSYRMMRFYNFLLAASACAAGYSLPLNCVPNNGMMTTPTYGTTGAIFTVCAQRIINSGSDPIYEVLIDFPRYYVWNTFVYSVDVLLNVLSAEDVYVGMPMTFHSSGLLPGINSTSNEQITYLVPDATPTFVGWKFDPGAIVELTMQAEHVSLLEDQGDGTTKYVSWETYYGVASVVVSALKSNLQKEFEDQARDLKALVEGS